MGGDGGGFLPGFGIVDVVGTVGFAVTIYTSKERNHLFKIRRK